MKSRNKFGGIALAAIAMAGMITALVTPARAGWTGGYWEGSVSQSNSVAGTSSSASGSYLGTGNYDFNWGTTGAPGISISDSFSQSYTGTSADMVHVNGSLAASIIFFWDGTGTAPNSGQFCSYYFTNSASAGESVNQFGSATFGVQWTDGYNEGFSNGGNSHTYTGVTSPTYGPNPLGGAGGSPTGDCWYVKVTSPGAAVAALSGSPSAIDSTLTGSYTLSCHVVVALPSGLDPPPQPGE